jgi:hypothetical protein
MKYNLYTFNTPRFTVKVDARMQDQDSLCMQSPLCFNAECSVIFHGESGPIILGESFLGDCVYDSPAQFRFNVPAMVRDALHYARKNVTGLCSSFRSY